MKTYTLEFRTADEMYTDEFYFAIRRDINSSGCILLTEGVMQFTFVGLLSAHWEIVGDEDCMTNLKLRSKFKIRIIT